MKTLVLAFSLLVGSFASASTSGFYGGIGLYSQNSLGRTTKADDSSNSFLGASTYPLALRYVVEFSKRRSFGPSLLFTPLPRQSGGNTAATTFAHFSLPAIYNFAGGGRDFELLAGAGLSIYVVKGAGGVKALNNGTGTSNFAVPSGTQSSRVVTLDLGFAIVENPHRVGLDVLIEGLGSTEKRSYNLMATYMFNFGGGSSW